MSIEEVASSDLRADVNVNLYGMAEILAHGIMTYADPTIPKVDWCKPSLSHVVPNQPFQ